jgi:hypothetical protein
MSQLLAGLRFPGDRTLLQRTKLAYVHLPRLLSDAKRDRSARVSAYVAIWLPECLLILYLKSGELVNASSDDGRQRRALSLAEAMSKIPAEPEWGEICFREAPDEQLACMYTAHAVAEEPWPESADGRPIDNMSVLHDSCYSGLVELTLDGHVNYLIFQDGKVSRGYLSGASHRPLAERAVRALGDSRKVSQLVRRFPLGGDLPAQAVPQLIRAYRDLMDALIRQLVDRGRQSAPAIAEHARTTLLASHPILAGFDADASRRFDPVCSPADLTRGIAAWATETVWAGVDLESSAPDELLRTVTRDRRHMLQSAGFFEHIPWKLEW